MTALHPKWDKVRAADNQLAYVRRALTNRFVNDVRSSRQELAGWEDSSDGVTTGSRTPLRVNDPAAERQLNAIFNAGATTLTRAITKAALSARSIGTATSYCDRYPSACKKLAGLHQWRTAGDAPEVTPQTFRAASTKLAIIPVPKPKK